VGGGGPQGQRGLRGGSWVGRGTWGRCLGLHVRACQTLRSNGGMFGGREDAKVRDGASLSGRGVVEQIELELRQSGHRCS